MKTVSGVEIRSDHQTREETRLAEDWRVEDNGVISCPVCAASVHASVMMQHTRWHVGLRGALIDISGKNMAKKTPAAPTA